MPKLGQVAADALEAQDRQEIAKPALEYALARTAFGWVAVAGSEWALVASTLPQESAGAALAALHPGSGAASESPRWRETCDRLRAYFDGEPVTFPEPVDLSRFTAFQRLVLSELRLVPYGQTCTYGSLAKACGCPRSARAAGQAVGRNPLPVIIPCHRVVAAQGYGGFGGGLDVKLRLLGLEGFSSRARLRARESLG